MHIGVPREIKNHEYRVGLTPSSVREMVEHGHQVTVESGAGTGIGATDEVYRKAGAVIADTAGEIFASAEMIIKVKEPQAASARCCARARSSIPICTSLPIPHSVPTWSAVARCASPMKRSPSRAAACRCWRRCRKSPAACRSRPAPIASKRRMAAWASCWAASPACRRRGSSSSVAASSARTPRRSPSAAVRRWWSSTATSTSCGAWIVCSARA
jgi:hypothetical protein